jgi:hypothetical protein
MADISMDDSEMRALAADLRHAADTVQGKVRPVVQKGALNIKNDIRRDLAGSTWFKGAAASVTYETKETAGGVEAEIGPDKAARGGALANIAFFGTSRGGGTVRDPRAALDAETPRFLKALADLADGAL